MQNDFRPQLILSAYVSVILIFGNCQGFKVECPESIKYFHQQLLLFGFLKHEPEKLKG